MMKIGHGNRQEMLEFAEEVKNNLTKGNFDLKVEVKQIQDTKYGELVWTNFFEVCLVGEENIIKEFLKTV